MVQDVEKDGARNERSGHEINSRLMAQLEPIVRLLKMVDSMEMPPNEFETALQHKLDVVPNLHTHPGAADKPTIVARTRPAGAARGNAQNDGPNFEVSLASNADLTAVEQAENAARKAALEQQNALPAWHMSSTVTAENTAAVESKSEASSDAQATVKEEVKSEVNEEVVKGEDGEQKPADAGLDESIAAYYAAMAKEAEEGRKEDEEEEEEEESDEEDEFEDVAVGAGAGAPATDAGESATEPTTLKREYDEFAADNDNNDEKEANEDS